MLYRHRVNPDEIFQVIWSEYEAMCFLFDLKATGYS